MQFADSIYQSAGGQDKNEAPLIEMPEEQQKSLSIIDNDKTENTSPMYPPKIQSPIEGINQGIETQEID